MALADTSYVREQDGMLYVGATQITVSSLIASWRNEGYSAEELQSDFPALSLAQVYGTIAYYLDHQQELDAQFATEDQEYYQQRAHDREADPDFYRQLDDAERACTNAYECLKALHTPAARMTSGRTRRWRRLNRSPLSAVRHPVCLPTLIITSELCGDFDGGVLTYSS